MTLNEANLEKKFNSVSTSQGSIQSLSFFCLHYKTHHKRIAQIWLRCLQKAEVPHRLTLIYLANDIVQNAKRKNVLSFIEDFKSVLKHTIPYLRDEKIKKSVERVFSIWQDRNIYDSKFTNELKAYLNDSGRGGEPKHEAPLHKINLTSVETKEPKHSQSELLNSLTRLSDIEKNEERLRSEDDNIIDRVHNGNLQESDLNDGSILENLREYIVHLKTEIDERSKLAKMLEDSTHHQKRILQESEEQLVMYRSQLEFITKHRDDINIA